MIGNIALFFTIIVILITTCAGRIHRLDITSDVRKYIAISTFGFYEGGVLDVKLENFRATPENASATFGFSLDRTTNDAMNPYLNNPKDQCILEQINDDQTTEDVTYFILDLKNKKLNVKCNHQKVIHVFDSKADIPTTFLMAAEHRRKRHNKEGGCGRSLDITSAKVNGHTYYNASFAILVKSRSEEGLYNLHFHNCKKIHEDREVAVDVIIEISEHNPDYVVSKKVYGDREVAGAGILKISGLDVSGYSSAGEIPVPAVHCVMTVLFLISRMFWVFMLWQF